MSSVEWDNLASAVTFRLEWERLCGRSSLLTENSLKQAVAEYLQAATTLKIVPEYNHSDLKGAKRLDIVGFGPQQKKIDLACEAKWIKDTQGTRDIHFEIADDIFRVECLRTDMAQQNERVLVVAGYSAPMQFHLYGKKKRILASGTNLWIDAILPKACSSTFARIAIEQSDLSFRPFFRKLSQETLSGKLPKSYTARMVASHTAIPGSTECIRCDIWLIHSARNRALFSF